MHSLLKRPSSERPSPLSLPKIAQPPQKNKQVIPNTITVFVFLTSLLTL